MIKSHGGERQGMMRSEEMNESEPLIKRRNDLEDVKTGGWTRLSG